MKCFLPQEYRRCAHALRGLGGPGGSPLHTFLRLYATYLAGEKRRE
jgi:anaphase-promoting complex subunit 8